MTHLFDLLGESQRGVTIFVYFSSQNVANKSEKKGENSRFTWHLE